MMNPSLFLIGRTPAQEITNPDYNHIIGVFSPESKITHKLVENLNTSTPA